jgi:hypothetical protein
MHIALVSLLSCTHYNTVLLLHEHETGAWPMLCDMADTSITWLQLTSYLILINDALQLTSYSLLINDALIVNHWLQFTSYSILINSAQ